MVVDKEVIRNIVADNVMCEAEDIGDDTDFISELGVSSVQMLEIVAGIEDEYDIEIKATDLGKYNTITKVIEALGDME